MTRPLFNYLLAAWDTPAAQGGSKDDIENPVNDIISHPRKSLILTKKKTFFYIDEQALAIVQKDIEFLRRD
jgi:hypothetical protein